MKSNSLGDSNFNSAEPENQEDVPQFSLEDDSTMLPDEDLLEMLE